MAEHRTTHSHHGDHLHEGHQHDASKLSHTDKNRQHWDNFAADYNKKHTQEEFGDLINKVTAFVLENVTWIGIDFADPSSTFEEKSEQSSSRPVRVLDYACGPGTMTNALIGYGTEFVGIDLSANMVKEYNNRFVESQDSQKVNAEAFNANLFEPGKTPTSLDDPKFFDFDLVVVGLGFHHFEDLPLVTKRLVERLKSGGVLLIVDFLTHAKNDMQGHPAHNTVSHHGFGEDEVRTLFSETGLIDCQTVVMKEQVLLRGTAWRTPFMARGKKPS